MHTLHNRIVALSLSIAVGLASVGPAAFARAEEPTEATSTVTPSAEPSAPVVGDEVSPDTEAIAQPVPDAVKVESQDTTPPAPYRLEDDASSVRFSGRWGFRNSEGASGRSERYSRTAGASAWTAFSGTGVTWIAPVGPDRGRARIYIDGKSAGTVDLYRSAVATAQPVWERAGLGNSRHTIKVVVLGSRNASSTASYVHFDALDLQGKPASVGELPGVRVQNGDSKLYRKGTWSTSRRSGAFGGSAALTTARDAGYSVRFKGTAITWFGRKNTAGGRSEVWLDGKRVATVDQYSPVQAERRVVYATTGLANRTHTLRIRALASPAATGGGTRTELDAFQIGGKLLFAFRPTPFKYRWKNYIVIDKSSYKLYLVKSGLLRAVYPVAHGKNNCTPTRVWRIDAKYPHTSGVYGPRKMRLFKRVRTSRGYRYVFSAYGIHGTNQPWVIGTQASHGCIRMYNKDVRALYPQVPLGTMVVTRK